MAITLISYIVFLKFHFGLQSPHCCMCLPHSGGHPLMSAALRTMCYALVIAPQSRPSMSPSLSFSSEPSLNAPMSLHPPRVPQLWSMRLPRHLRMSACHPRTTCSSGISSFHLVGGELFQRRIHSLQDSGVNQTVIHSLK